MATCGPRSSGGPASERAFPAARPAGVDEPPGGPSLSFVASCERERSGRTFWVLMLMIPLLVALQAPLLAIVPGAVLTFATLDLVRGDSALPASDALEVEVVPAYDVRELERARRAIPVETLRQT